MKITAGGIFWCVTALFVGASLYYTHGAMTFKAGLRGAGQQAPFASGQAATVGSVIDGDEVAVIAGEARFIVRLLGIWSYDATANDTLTQGRGRDAVNYLESALLGKEVRLEFEEFRRDRAGRVLAYLRADGRDTGYDMVSKGICLAYDKYPFPRMEAYLAAEAGAKKKKLGIWADPATAERSLALKRVWELARMGREED